MQRSRISLTLSMFFDEKSCFKETLTPDLSEPGKDNFILKFILKLWSKFELSADYM